MEKTILLFAYGTLMSGYGNNAYLKKQKLIGKGKTVGEYTMYASCIPFINENEKTSQIHGELWEVDIRVLPYIDALENHPNWYQRKEVPVTVDGKTYTAWLYFNDETHGTKVVSGDFNEYNKQKQQQYSYE